MPLQVRIYIRTALAYLLIAALLGAFIMVSQGLQLQNGFWALLPVFYHVLFVGWTSQLICGVALWMFPVHTKEQPRGNERIGWIAFACLNSGLLLRAIAEPFQSWKPQAWSGMLLVVAAFLQVVAIWLIVIMLWPRVKGKKVVSGQ